MFWNGRKNKSKPQIKTIPYPEFTPKEIPKWQAAYDECTKKSDNHQQNEKNHNVKNEWENKFLKSFQKLSYKYRVWDVWKDYVTLNACAISNAFDKGNYEHREKRYLEIIGRYAKDEQQIFPELAAYTVMALEENSEQDFLGKMYMDLELGNRSSGQFFTPYNVCELMAEMTVQDAVEKISEQGYVSLNDPCCGAGATLIAGANAIRKELEKDKQQLNYQNHVLVIAQDIDEIVALMCYIQISLLGLAGFVKVGNSIINPISTDDSFENYWYTPMYFSDVWRTRRTIKQINQLFGNDEEQR